MFVFQKNATIRTVVRWIAFVGFQFRSFASHRDDATRDRRRSRRRKKRVENLLLVSFLFSSYSFLGRAWRYVSEKRRHDAVRDAANMPRCGNGSGDDDATRRCDDGDDGDDASARGWNGIFVVDVRRAVSATMTTTTTAWGG